MWEGGGGNADACKAITMSIIKILVTGSFSTSTDHQSLSV